MKNRLLVTCFAWYCWLALGTTGAHAQDPQSLLQSVRSMVQQQGVEGGLGTAPVVPERSLLKVEERDPDPALLAEEARLEAEIRQMKAQERGPARFASDLFDVRQRSKAMTDGGVSEDYLIGTGDRLNVSAFGSANFEVPVQVDGRGVVVIPRLGPVRIGGRSLGQAKQLIEQAVQRQFSNTTVDVQAVKLREVRVFVMGEVYKSGSFVVPSLSSIVNVLSLAGGPRAMGSYRSIRVIRGGQVVHSIDLYPMRAEGLGNPNIYFQNGDTVFVPLAMNQILLEGAFTRLAAAAQDETSRETDLFGAGTGGERERSLRRQIQQLEARLDADRTSIREAPRTPSAGASLPPMADSRANALPRAETPSSETAQPSLSFAEREVMEQRLEGLRAELSELLRRPVGDSRIKDPFGSPDPDPERPAWLARWELEGRVPTMQFEMLPSETVADALKYAGGFDVAAFSEHLTLRRMDASGAWNGVDVARASWPATVLHKGDILTALPLRDRSERVVKVRGWVRIPGLYSRTEGLKVADLLRRDNLVLPDTYLPKGEITRRLPDGATRYLTFDLAKALQGDPSHNLPLEDRDELLFYRTEDLRLHGTLTITGPIQRPGMYDFHEGMRASDLLFRAGIPLRGADLLVAELAHIRDGKQYEIRKLDLTRLLSSDASSPVDLKDEGVNPKLEPFDEVHVYAMPDYKPIRLVTLSGQFVRPGQYALDSRQTTLKDLVERAGGLTDEAMPEGAIFLRKLWQVDPDKAKAATLISQTAIDPTSNGINQTLEKLAEKKRNPVSGSLQPNPILNGLQAGSIGRLIVDFPGLLKGSPEAELMLEHGDEIIMPTRTDAAYVVGEAASPFSAYKVTAGLSVSELLKRAGGLTRNADKGAIRLLKANGRIVDQRVSGQVVEPGDAILVPQRIRRDVSWQENLQALTPIALILNAIRR